LNDYNNNRRINGGRSNRFNDSNQNDSINNNNERSPSRYFRSRSRSPLNSTPKFKTRERNQDERRIDRRIRTEELKKDYSASRFFRRSDENLSSSDDEISSKNKSPLKSVVVCPKDLRDRLSFK
jgi:hypothetical protein